MKPENKAYLPARCAQAGPVIRPEGELEIFRVVVGLVKNTDNIIISKRFLTPFFAMSVYVSVAGFLG